MCPSVEIPGLVYQQAGYTQSLTHSRPTECGNRQAIQARPDNSEWSPSRGLPGSMQQVTPTSNRPFYSKVQQHASKVCITSVGPPGLGSQCTQPAMGGSGPICLPTSSYIGQSGGEVARLPMQENNSDYSGVAKHALVLGSSGHVQSDSTVPGQPAQSAHSAIHPNLNMHAWLSNQGAGLL